METLSSRLLVAGCFANNVREAGGKKRAHTQIDWWNGEKKYVQFDRFTHKVAINSCHSVSRTFNFKSNESEKWADWMREEHGQTRTTPVVPVSTIFLWIRYLLFSLYCYFISRNQQIWRLSTKQTHTHTHALIGQLIAVGGNKRACWMCRIPFGSLRLLHLRRLQSVGRWFSVPWAKQSWNENASSTLMFVPMKCAIQIEY